jgi:hypothetical protein
MQGHEIHERAAGLFVPDTLLPAQYFDRVRRRRDLTGEQRLMCAVIEDAVDVYLKHAAATQRTHQGLFAEADQWIESEDRSWIYSFETICDYLGMDSGYLRRGLRAWKARARGETPVAATGDEVVDTPEQRRAMNE